MLDLINAYENHLIKVKQASKNTVSSYMRDIRQFSAWLLQNEGVTVLNANQLHIRNYLDYLNQQGKSSATASRTLASLKNFYNYVVSAGFLEVSPVTGRYPIVCASVITIAFTCLFKPLQPKRL